MDRNPQMTQQNWSDFKKIIPRHSGKVEFNIYQFHVEIKCILKLTSPNQIQRKTTTIQHNSLSGFFILNVVWPLLNCLKHWPKNLGFLCGLRKINGNPSKETRSLHTAMGSTFDQSHMLQPPIIVLRRLSSHFILAAFQRRTGGFKAFSWVTNQIIFHGFHL